MFKLNNVKLTYFCGRSSFQRDYSYFVNPKKIWRPDDQLIVSFKSPSGIPGSGAGKGGGAGGSIRESGGGLGEYGAAQEEHYFFNKQRDQLKKIKNKQKAEKSGEGAHKEEK